MDDCSILYPEKHTSTSSANSSAQHIVNSIQTILSGGHDPVDDVSALPLDSGATTDLSDNAPDPVSTHTPGDAFGRHAYTQHTQKRCKQGQVRILQCHVASTHTFPALPTPTESYCKLDSHADTCCLGTNFLPLEFTGQECEVAPFLPKFGATPNIPLCTGATTYIHPDTHEPIVLIIHEALWFGERLPHTLINPNQCRYHGISLCNDPYDPHRNFGLIDPDSQLHIPFTLSGTIATLGPTHTPTPNKLCHCRRLVLTSLLPWHPSTANLLDRQKDEAAHIATVETSRRTKSDCCLNSISETLCPSTFCARDVASVNIYDEHSHSDEHFRADAVRSEK